MAGPRVQDNELTKSVAMPAADGSVSTAAIQVKGATTEDLVAEIEAILSMPILDATLYPVTATCKVDIMHGTTATVASMSALYDDFINHTSTGASVAAADYVVALPSDCHQYIAATCTMASISDMSDYDMELSVRT